jgi:hypothetical protein
MFQFRSSMATAILAISFTCAATAAPALTTVQDTIYSADGSLFNGVLAITWQPFTAADTSVIAAQSLKVPVVNGYLSVSLIPTTNAITPATYTVVYISGGRNQSTETWGVPPSTLPVRIQDIRTSPAGSLTQLPNVAIQIGDVTGLAQELSLRPVEGPSFATGAVAVIDALGEIDGASGNAADCMHVDGSSGPCGTGNGPGPPVFVDHETPGGVQNSVNQTFTLVNAPSPAASLSLFRNGVLMESPGDYTLNANTITLSASDIPRPSDVLDASYRYGVNGSGITFVDAETPRGAVNGVNTSFTLANAPSPTTSLRLYRNGLAMKPAIDYNAAGSTITFLGPSTPQTGDILLVCYRM